MIYFGTSIGIVIRGDHLEVVCARGRWNSVSVTGLLRIENFLSRPVHEVAALYRQFRKDNQALATSAVVAIPRGQGLVRLLDLPAQASSNLAQVIGYQVDTLHPFEEGAMVWDWARLPAGSGGGSQAADAAAEAPANVTVAVALAERAAIEKLSEWFASAGIDVACFTFTGAAMYRALESGVLRTRAGRAARAVVLLGGSGDSIEILGISPDGRFYSREIPTRGGSASLEREMALCAAELRLGEGHDVVVVGSFSGDRPAGNRRLEQGLLQPLPEVKNASFGLPECFAAYSTALLGLEWRLPSLAPRSGLRWNLLPPEKRVYRSHWAHNAAYALAVLVLLLGAVRVTSGWAQDRYYSAWLGTQIQALAPRVQYLDKLDSRQKALLARIELVEREQQNITRKMGAWRELTRLLPNTVWLQSMTFTENQVSVGGQADSASGLLQTIGQSPYFEQAEFLGAPVKNADGKESFQIRIRLREMPLASTPPAAAQVTVSAPAAGAPPPAPAGNGGARSAAANAGKEGK